MLLFRKGRYEFMVKWLVYAFARWYCDVKDTLEELARKM